VKRVHLRDQVIPRRPGRQVKLTTGFLVAAVLGTALSGTSGAQSPPARSVWSGIFSDAQARRGEPLYRLHCGSCHGDDLAGRPLAQPWPSGRDRVPELIGATFNSNWDGLTLDDLVTRIRISMPQDRPGSLSPQDNVDIVAYLLWIGGFPTGDRDLTTQRDALRETMFLERQP
jgi:hypothetical protein